MNNFFGLLLQGLIEFHDFRKAEPNVHQCDYFYRSETTSNLRAKIFKQKICFRAMRCQQKVKIDIDAANSFLIKQRRSKYVKVISLNSYGRAMRYTFFFLLESPFLGLRLELLRKVSISYVVSSKSVSCLNFKECLAQNRHEI